MVQIKHYKKKSMSIRECVQCSAVTKSGQQCKRRTCKYADQCWQHVKMNEHLEIKKSHIRQSGQGLYTTRPIRKKAKVTDYIGVIKSQEDYEANDSGYGVHLNKNEILDAYSTQHGLGRYANDCRIANKRAHECKGNNAKLVINTRRKTATVRATKNIRTNDEIFVSYGRHYWTESAKRKKS